MKQIFNKKQLVVIWIVGIFACVFLIWSSISIRKNIQKVGLYDFSSSSTTRYSICIKDWPCVLLYPVIIIGGLLVVTLGNRELLEEKGKKLSRKMAQDLDKARRKRDAAFLKCWKKGMSDEELAGKFDLKVQGVKASKERLGKEKGR